MSQVYGSGASCVTMCTCVAGACFPCSFS
jgi:hypothetical protein